MSNRTMSNSRKNELNRVKNRAGVTVKSSTRIEPVPGFRIAI